MLHELRGNDAQHLDVEEETIPQKAWIGSQTTANTHQTQLDLFDYSALLKTSRQVVTDICTLLADGQQRSVHKENRALLEQLQQREENIRKELERLAEAADPHRCADFHLGEESAFDLNASNYFDRPNPQFFCERRIQGGKDGHADGGHLSK